MDFFKTQLYLPWEWEASWSVTYPDGYPTFPLHTGPAAEFDGF